MIWLITPLTSASDRVTGTKSPMDLFSQSAAAQLNSYFAFQNRLCKRIWAPAFQEITDIAAGRTEPKLDGSNRTLKEDCLDLPDKNIRRDVALTDEQKSLYTDEEAGSVSWRTVNWPQQPVC